MKDDFRVVRESNYPRSMFYIGLLAGLAIYASVRSLLFPDGAPAGLALVTILGVFCACVVWLIALGRKK